MEQEYPPEEFLQILREKSCCMFRTKDAYYGLHETLFILKYTMHPELSVNEQKAALP